MKIIPIAVLCCTVFMLSLRDNPISQNREDLKLKGPVKRVEIFVVTNLKKSKKWRKNKVHPPTLYEVYHFDTTGNLTAFTNSIPKYYRPNFSNILDSAEFSFNYDSTRNCQIATKKMPFGSEDYEIHYQWMDENNNITRDSTRKGTWNDEMFIEGPIESVYHYNKQQHLTYCWWRSSYMFALKGEIRYEYKYDEQGNWIELRAGEIQGGGNSPLTESELDQLKVTYKWKILRYIDYY